MSVRNRRSKKLAVFALAVTATVPAYASSPPPPPPDTTALLSAVSRAQQTGGTAVGIGSTGTTIASVTVTPASGSSGGRATASGQSDVSVASTRSGQPDGGGDGH